MKPRIVDLLLIALIAVGGLFAWRSGRERAGLDAEYDRLTGKVGELTVGDPARIHLKAVETGEPLHFAWRLYVPANATLTYRVRSGGGGSSMSGNARDALARVRLREREGRLQAYYTLAGGSSTVPLGDPALADLLRGRWDELVVEQPGATGTVTLAPDEPATLLRVSLPDDLADEARRVLDPNGAGRLIPDLFTLEIGPEARKP